MDFFGTWSIAGFFTLKNNFRLETSGRVFTIVAIGRANAWN
ncbi:hypothetical protein BMETH_2220_0 [methanotrophic bacterial endosymbiont of Bathymodiolus sp.]|nr:hypothetical protein BMETH_2220_0 [methanotrophic bacterial endosymbiont of Bathymodiolus sp.]